MNTKSTTVDQEEIAQFEAVSDHWWDESGPFKPLHKLTPARMEYLCGQIDAHFGITDRAKYKKLSILDIGCGGGLACEPLARLGAKVTGLDASVKNINIAIDHAAQSGLDIEYFPIPAEDYVQKGKQFDVVTALEIIEHVADIPLFVETCTKLVKPNGLLIFSTLNRNVKSFLMGIIAAEYLLRWVPQGTHSWDKFVKPSELTTHIRLHGFTPKDITGLRYNPIKDTFTLDPKDLDVNYFMSFTKES